MIKILLLLLTNFTYLSLNNYSNSTNLLSKADLNYDMNLGSISFIKEKEYFSLNTNQTNSLYFKFNKKLNDILDITYPDKMGIVIKNNNKLESTYLNYESSFKNNFVRYEIFYSFNKEFSDNDSISSFKYYVSNSIFEIEFNRKLNEIESIDLFYGDNTLEISEAYLGKKMDNITNIEYLPSFNENSYHPIKILHTNKLNKIKSNYGYSLSLAYIKNEYQILDDSSEVLYKIDNIDLDLLELEKSELGTKIFITFSNQSSQKEASVEVEIVDNLSPTIIRKEDNNIFTTKDINEYKEGIHNYFYIYDNYTKVDKLKIEISNYEDIKNKYGILNLDLNVSDENNNTSKYFSDIVIKDVSPPILELKYKHIVTTKDKIITLEDIYSLISAKDLESDIKEINITKNTYTNNENINGTYYVEISVIDLYDNISQTTLYISVKDDSSNTYEYNGEILYYKNKESVSIEDIVNSLIVTKQINNHNYLVVNILEGNDLDNLESGFNYLLIELISNEETITKDIVIYIESVEDDNVKSFSNFIQSIINIIKNIFHIT